MSVFISTLNQTAVLISFILIGFVLKKKKKLPDNTSVVLARLENMLFVPALVMGTFIEKFTLSEIGRFGKLFGISFIMIGIMMPVAVLLSKLLTKDKYEQNIFTYGLAFSNFGFVGNAVVQAVFPEIFLEYMIFVLPLWIMIYLWGVPVLLIGGSGDKQVLKDRLKAFVNPMFIGMLIGMLIGLSGFSVPKWLLSVVTVSGSCMSPIAMILTGVTVAEISLKKTFTSGKIYTASILRLLVIPGLFIAVSKVVPMERAVYACGLCALAMPLGMNTVVVPGAYGKDTSLAAGMAVVSHLLGCITIPLIFMLGL